MMRKAGIAAAIFLCAMLIVSAIVACSAGAQRDTAGQNLAASETPAERVAASANAVATFPPGPDGELIRYGHDLIAQTQRYAGRYVTAQMSCSACHVADGRQPHAGSLLGTYARFPQWNKRAHRFIALQDRIAECFLYSMNGRPPAYYSHEMIAITAYIAWLSRGARVGEGFPGQEPLALAKGLKPDANAGAHIYAARCAMCHGVNGAGVSAAYPPLWGPTSFNDRAGMSRMDRIAPFVRVAMPQNAPGSLSDQQALDVAAYVLSKPRPHFERAKLVQFPLEHAGYF